MSDDEDKQTAPLQDLRPFYRSRARQDLAFVPASTAADEAAAVEPNNRISDAYLSIVLKSRRQSDSDTLKDAQIAPGGEEQPRLDTQSPSQEQSAQICLVCNLPITSSDSTPLNKPHEASLAHQVCLSHSHPPSHLDRRHIGLRYLASHGWDPDSRRGLGAEGSGILAPVKAVEKNNTAGLGLAFQKAKEVSPVRKETLDAGKVRKQYAQERRKEARLREIFYGDDKIAKYLGENG